MYDKIRKQGRARCDDARTGEQVERSRRITSSMPAGPHSVLLWCRGAGTRTQRDSHIIYCACECLVSPHRKSVNGYVPLTSGILLGCH